MAFEDRRDQGKPGRRDEDERWLKVQEQIMNLVTAERTDQQELASMKTQVEKIADHVEDLDDHLRGVAGHDSLDTRVAVLEKHTTENSVLLREIKRKLEGVKTDVEKLTLHQSMELMSEETRTKRLEIWLKLWGPIIMASIALILPLTDKVLDNWSKIKSFFKQEDAVSKYVQTHQPVKRTYRVRVVKPKEPPKELPKEPDPTE